MLMPPPWQYIVLLLSAGLMGAISLIVWRRKDISAAPPFLILLIMAGGWCLISATDIATTSIDVKIFLLKFKFCFLPLMPVLLLETAYRYAKGRRLLVGWKLWVSLVIPVVTAILAVTTETHPHFRSHFFIYGEGTFQTLAYKQGAWMFVHYGYSFILEFWAMGIMINLIRRSPEWARPANITLLFVGLLPAVVDMFYAFGLSPTPWFNYTPVLFAVTGSMIVWAFFGHRLFELAPVARSVLVERLREMLIVLDADDRVVDLNAAACKGLNVQLEKCLAMPAAELLALHPDIQRMVASHVPVENTEVSFQGDQDGHTHECSILNVPEDDPEPRARILLIRDISERKATETALREARDAAEAADKAKSQFLATMSHEIRTPMNGVIGFLDLLKVTALNAEQKDYVELISNSSESLLVIINDILDYSKIEAGHLQIEEKPLALRELISRMASLHLPSAKLKNITLTLQVDESTPHTFCGDTVRVGQILNNLLSNAVKFTSEGGVVLSVRCGVAQDSRIGEELLEFSVQDTGIGISPEQHHRLFKPFSQADGSITRTYGGTGLGLIISQTLCALMGGQIRVESAAGKGSTFTCAIPVRRQDGAVRAVFISPT